MKIGAIVPLHEEDDAARGFAELKELGLASCQLVVWNRALLNRQTATAVNAAAESYGVEISALWCGWEGPQVWDFYAGQLTLGLVPTEYRFRRMEMLREGSDFAKLIHVDKLVTHAGFMPENPYDPRYAEVVEALKNVAGYCRENGQYFLFETGQETPVTLKRAIEDIGLDNVGINLDPANLILYGKANPVDALDVFGEYVMGVHGKDALYPTDGRHLGAEVPMGEGKVDFPRLIARLKELGYNGPITIEREISGQEQRRDILRAKCLLETLV